MALRKNVKRIDPRYFLNETVLREEENLPLNTGDIIQYHPISNPDDGPYNAVVDEVEYKPGHWLGRDVEQLRSGQWIISSTASRGRGLTGPYELVVGVHPANDEEHIGF
jgi:hypothetical protein